MAVKISCLMLFLYLELGSNFFLFTLRLRHSLYPRDEKSKVSRKFLDIMAIIIQMVGVVILSLFVLLAVVQ